MCGVGALAMLSGGVCSLRPAVYEATEGAIFRVSLAHRGSPAVAAHALARGCSRCAWSLRCVGGLTGIMATSEKLPELTFAGYGVATMCAI